MAAEAIPNSPMLRTVFTKTIRDQRRALMWWGLGFVGTVFMYSAFWPTIRSNAGQFNDYIAKLPEAVRNLIGGDYGTPQGYIQAEIFSLLTPVLVLVYAIGAGARALAGEEEGGTLDLLLSAPIRRRRVVLDKFWAMVGAALLLVFLTWAAIAVIGRPYGLTVSMLDLSAAVVNLFLLGTAFGSIALAVGGATGNKGMAIGVTSGLALITFIVKTLAPSVPAMKPLRYLSPFYYYADHRPLATGFHAVDIAVLAGISLVALVVALLAFERRDLSS
jgi:ABC-2 type transport system permease protein